MDRSLHAGRTRRLTFKDLALAAEGDARAAAAFERHLHEPRNAAIRELMSSKIFHGALGVDAHVLTLHEVALAGITTQ